MPVCGPLNTWTGNPAENFYFSGSFWSFEKCRLNFHCHYSHYLLSSGVVVRVKVPTMSSIDFLPINCIECFPESILPSTEKKTTREMSSWCNGKSD